MILDLEQIKNLTVGAVDVKKKEDGIHFLKMQKCQIDAFYALSDILEFRAETTTGIRLDFETDSKYLAFDIKKGNRFEYLIDGVYQGTLTSPRIELNAPCRITLVYPPMT